MLLVQLLAHHSHGLHKLASTKKLGANHALNEEAFVWHS